MERLLLCRFSSKASAVLHKMTSLMSTTSLRCRGLNAGTRSFVTPLIPFPGGTRSFAAPLLLLQTPHKATRPRLLCTSTQVLKDVVLFRHDRTRFFRLLAVFCGGQLVFWSYLAHFAYTGLRDTSSASGGQKAAATTTTTTSGLAGPWSFDMNLGSSAWRYGFTAGCLAVGGLIAGLGALFCLRSVSQVVLHRGGRTVTVVSQSPLGAGRGRSLTVPLAHVACHAHRHESPSFIPLRVKGHRFYFLLDKDGALNNVKLFDVTVGAYRPV